MMRKTHLVYFVLLFVLLFSFLILPACTATRADSQNYPEEIKNIETFARLFGYVKYYHPSDEASHPDLDWDSFAVYGAKRAAEAKNPAHLKRILEELFKPIAPSLTIYLSGKKKKFSIDTITPEDTSGMDVISWQHKGATFGKPHYIYKSIRINRPTAKSGTPVFCAVSQSISAAPYLGKKFILKASAKVEKGSARLWFRVDRPNRKIGFFDNMGNRPISKNEWTAYEIKGTIDPDAVIINFGAIMKGNGKAFMDDFQLLIQNGDSWKPVALKNLSFEEGSDKTTQFPLHWRGGGKGFTIRTTNESAVNGSLSLLLFKEGNFIDKASPMFEVQNKIGSHIDKDIGQNLSCIMPLALYGTPKNTCPAAPPGSLENLIAQLNTHAPKQLSASDPYIRYAAVISVWNVMQHFYPYFEEVKVDWNPILPEFLFKAQKDKNPADFYFTLASLMERLKDGHGRVIYSGLAKQAGFPFLVWWVEDEVVVIASNDKNVQPGDIIVSIDNENAKKIFHRAASYASGSPQWKKARAAMRFAYGPENSISTITIKRGDTTLKINATRNFKQHRELREFKRQPFEEIEKDIFYIDASAISMKTFSSILPELKEANGIIFDCRRYVPYNKKDILSYLTKEPLKSPIFHLLRTTVPDRENAEFHESHWTITPQQPFLKAKVAFITHNYAISASETFLSIVKHYKLGPIIGQTTAGTNGDVNPFVVPGNYRIIWTGLKVLNYDHSQFHLNGIAPTISREMTIKGLQQGKDELLLKALETIR
jgi:hypothetical protein